MLYNKFSHKIFLTEKSLLSKLAHILDKFVFKKSLTIVSLPIPDPEIII